MEKEDVALNNVLDGNVRNIGGLTMCLKDTIIKNEEIVHKNREVK